MFLNKLEEQNKKFIDACVTLHKRGDITADSYVIDVDTFLDNAKRLLSKANENNIELYFMTKQIGRNPYLSKKLIEIGYEGAVVVDFKEALTMIKHNIPIANVGHLVQVPKNLLEKILISKPKYFTVESVEICEYISEICVKHNIVQNLLIKVIDLSNDTVYDSQYAGIEIDKLSNAIDRIKNLDNINISGVTTFPALLFNKDMKKIVETPNIKTINRAIEICENKQVSVTNINLPSATAISSIECIKKLGGTSGEPGHGLTGTTPAHLYETNTEKPAILYVSEISHNLEDKSYCYGGGFYARGNLKNAYVYDKNNNKFETTTINPNPESIDYYYGLKGNYNYADTVIMLYRFQVFTSRSNVVLLKGVDSDCAEIIAEYTSGGIKIE